MIQKNDLVILSGQDENFFIRAGRGKIGTDHGLIDSDALAGMSAGEMLRTHTGKTFVIRIPRAPDFFAHAKRSGTPMLPRDIGLVTGLTGMNRTDIVLDAGTGSGIAAIFFGGIAAEVVSYEARHEFAEAARETILDAGLCNVTVISGNVLDATGRYDIVHLDLPVTGAHVTHAHALLVPGGYLACYSPFFEQMALAYDTASGLFAEVTSHETIAREMDRSKRGTRPSTRICHSGYLTIARK
ncbi:MAG: protein-L-isoaspartate carboxylmethyltransferase [Methanospirillaceae archaeon]|nr:protein-L-isoaspartate carboxylmethyltransferase [Methanospirillaceae archaeon]